MNHIFFQLSEAIAVSPNVNFTMDIFDGLNYIPSSMTAQNNYFMPNKIWVFNQFSNSFPENSQIKINVALNNARIHQMEHRVHREFLSRMQTN